MSWRDTLKSQSVAAWPMMGSYGGARFICPESGVRVGRRTQVHELPQRDTPIIDDLGRRARQIEIEVFVDGSLVAGGDYMSARDALIDALEAPGPATLVHPWYGTLRVSLAGPARVREDSRGGGRATFTLALVEDGGKIQAPTSAAYTPAQTQHAADAADSAAVKDFAKRWTVANLPDSALAALSADLARTLSGIERRTGGITAGIAAEMRNPYGMGADILGAIHRLADSAANPLQALRLYQGLFAAGDGSAVTAAPAALPSPSTPISRRREVGSAAALHAIVQRGAVAAAARQSSRVVYDNRSQALGVRADVLDALDTQMAATDPVRGAPIDDTVYQSLAALRAAVADDLRIRGAQLPALASYTLQATQPALVVAHRLYGDAGRADEIVARNAIRHPGFVPGGEVLEVLNA